MQYAGSSWDELKHIRQAVGFMVCSFLHFLYLVVRGLCDSYESLDLAFTNRSSIKSTESRTMTSHMIYALWVPLSAWLFSPDNRRILCIRFFFWIWMLCSILQILSVQQLYRICTLYWDDSYNTRSVSQDVCFSAEIALSVFRRSICFYAALNSSTKLMLMYRWLQTWECLWQRIPTTRTAAPSC